MNLLPNDLTMKLRRPRCAPPSILAVLLLALIVAPALPAGAAKKKGSDSTFEGTSNVVEVQVPVNVTTRDGTPVRGLTADDFEVYDNGDLHPVSGFDVIDLDRLEKKPDAIERQGLPAVARRHFVLLFDLSFSSPAAILKARLAARQFVLHSLHPSDLAAVVTYSLETGPELVVTFTPDRAQLARAIDTLGAPLDERKRASLDPLRFMLSTPASLIPEASAGALEGRSSDRVPTRPADAAEAHRAVVALQIDRSDKAYERNRVSAWSRSLAGIAKALNSVPGRKQVVFFSEGFDSTLLLGRRPQDEDERATADRVNLMRGNFWMVDLDDFYGNSGLQQDLQAMLKEFRRTDSVIQAVDIGGLRADANIGGGRRDAGQDALFYMAKETGGNLFEDANDLEDQLSRVLDRSTVTYLLSFVPTKMTLDGAYHQLKVKLKNRKDSTVPRGAVVSYRSGYYAPRPFHDLHPLEKSLLASDAIASAEPRHDLDLSVLAAPFRSGTGQAYVPVILEIGGRALLAGNDGGKLPVEIYAYVTDSKGEMKDFFSQVVTVDLSHGKSSLLRGGLKYYGHLSLGPGRYLVRVLVRNAQTGKTGVETAPLEIPNFEASKPELLTPFVLEQDHRWLLVREKEGGTTRKRSVVYPFTVNGQPYVPAAHPLLAAHGQSQVCLVAYNLGSGDPVVQAQVLAADGTPVDGPRVSRVERTVTGIQGLDKLLLSVDLHGLDAGDYTLQVALKHAGTGGRLSSSIPFSVIR